MDGASRPPAGRRPLLKFVTKSAGDSLRPPRTPFRRGLSLFGHDAATEAPAVAGALSPSVARERSPTSVAINKHSPSPRRRTAAPVSRRRALPALTRPAGVTRSEACVTVT